MIDAIRPGIRSHHERVDGNGYPDGLTGKDIPLAARIIAVVDVFDTLTSKRIYRKGEKAFSDVKAIRELEKSASAGGLDGRVVAALKKSYYSGNILMARATSYAEMSNPLVTDAGGEDRPPLLLASEALKTACMKNNSIKWKIFALPDLTYLKILIRLATLANTQGKPQETLQYVKRALRLSEEHPELPNKQAQVLIERAISFRHLGNNSQAQSILQDLADVSLKDWMAALSSTHLAEIMLDDGNVKEATEYIQKARLAVRKMKESLERDQRLSPLEFFFGGGILNV